MAILVIGSTAYITEYYAVVGRVGLSVAGLALGRQQSLGRLPPLHALRWFWDYGHECDGLVHTAAGLCSCGEWCVRV